MEKSSRELQVNQKIWVIDFNGVASCSRAYAYCAKILSMSNDGKSFIAEFNLRKPDNPERYKGAAFLKSNLYSVDDYGSLYFIHKSDAMEVLKRIPVHDDEIYCISIDNKVVKKEVDCIVGFPCFDTSNIYSVCVQLTDNTRYPIKEIGISMFLDYEEACLVAKIKRKMNNTETDS